METLMTFQPRTYTPAFNEDNPYVPRAWTPAPGEQRFVPRTFTPAYIHEELDEEEYEQRRPW